jgi:hypothetical protein
MENTAEKYIKTNSVSAAFHWVRINLLANLNEDLDLLQTTVFDDRNRKTTKKFFIDKKYQNKLFKT